MFVSASDIGVAGITAGATVLVGLTVAIITARTTNSRQAKQLAADFQRQEQQLAHARELSDLADLRSLLDEGAVALFEAVLAARRLVNSTSEELPDNRKGVAEELRRLHALSARLRVRLGSHDPVAVQFNDGYVAMWELWETTAPVPGETQTTGKALAALVNLTDAVPAFLRAAVDRAGTVPTKANNQDIAYATFRSDAQPTVTGCASVPSL